MKKIYNVFTNFINKHMWLFVALTFLPFIYTKMLLSTGPMHIALFDHNRTLRLFFLIICIILYLKQKRKPSKLFILITIYEIYMLTVTYFNNNDFFYDLAINVPIHIEVIFLLDFFSYDYKNLIKGLMLTYEIGIYANFISILKFTPLGFDGSKNYLLGYYTTHTLYLLPAISIAFIYMYINRKYLRGLILSIIVIISSILLKCATLIVTIAAFIALFVLLILFKNKIRLNSYLLLISYFLFSYFFIFVFIPGKYKIIDFLIENVLHKNLLFSGRRLIWENAIPMIKENYIFGYGYGKPIVTILEIGSHCHNNLMQQIFAGGIIAFALYIIINILILDKINKNNANIRIILLAIMFSLYISFIMEAYNQNHLIYIIYGIVFYSINYIYSR